MPYSETGLCKDINLILQCQLNFKSKCPGPPLFYSWQINLASNCAATQCYISRYQLVQLYNPYLNNLLILLLYTIHLLMSIVKYLQLYLKR